MNNTAGIVAIIIVIIILAIIAYLISGPGEKEGTIINRDGRVYLVKGLDSTSVTDGMTIKSEKSENECFSRMVEFRLAIENESDDSINQATIEVSIDPSTPTNSNLTFQGNPINVGVIQNNSGNEVVVQLDAGNLPTGQHELKIKGTGVHQGQAYTDQATLKFCKN
jgi:hypothetical protein